MNFSPSHYHCTNNRINLLSDQQTSWLVLEVQAAGAREAGNWEGVGLFILFVIMLKHFNVAHLFSCTYTLEIGF